MTESPPPAKSDRVPNAYADDALRAWAKKTPGADYNRAAARLDDLLKPIDRALGLSEWDKLIDQVKDEMEAALPAPERSSSDGAALFSEVVERIRGHFYFDEEWHYWLCSLFVFQAWAVRAGALPATFYLYFGGPFSSGKSNILRLVSDLTDGLTVENISPPALARSIEAGRTVLLDEIDVSRGAELDDIMAALLRSGYRRNGPPYIRWDAKAKTREVVPIFGPKAATFRSSLDTALQSRGFVIPTAKPVGEAGYDLVLANLWVKTTDLVSRLKSWGKRAAREWPGVRLEQLAHTPEFRAEVKAVAGEIGANRESELLTIALLVARMVPVDVGPQLSSARALRDVEVGEDQAEALGELRDVVLVSMGKTVSFGDAGAQLYRVVQRSVRDSVNLRRKDRQEKPLTSNRLALLRRELGVKDVWLRNHHGNLVWNLPPAFVDKLRGDTPESGPHPHHNPTSTPQPHIDPTSDPTSVPIDVSEGSRNGSGVGLLGGLEGVTDNATSDHSDTKNDPTSDSDVGSAITPPRRGKPGSEFDLGQREEEEVGPP